MSSYRDKTLGCWLGKNIGGTLGGPFEGQQAQLYLHYYDPVPTESLPNDDFELQLVWLDMLNKKGIFITPRDFVYHWQNHALYYISEYFMGQRNMALGILPPMSGAFNNWFVNGMGATIRAEIWATIAPGLPDIATAYAYMDASVDHTAEGLHGEMFFAALESAAFCESDPWKLVDTGLAYLPPKCVVRDVVEFVKSEVKKNTPWRSIRHLICAHYSHPSDFTYVPTNLGFAVMGLLTGQDFADALCNAVNCGYDTDCTGATLGAILGIRLGAEAIPSKWLEPIGTAIKVTELVPGIDFAPDVVGVSDQVCAHGKAVLADPDAVRQHLYNWTGLEFLGKPISQSISLPPSTRVKLACEHGIAVAVDYHDHPAIGSGEEKNVTIVIHNIEDREKDVAVEADVPNSWTAPEHMFRLHMEARSHAELPLLIRTAKDATVNPSNNIGLTVTEGSAATIRTSLAIVGKGCWFVTKPIPASDAMRISDIETKGCLDPQSADRLQLESDFLAPLVPSIGHVVFAQTNMYVERDTNVRLIANNTGPISVFLNGEIVIRKLHQSAGITPSWHLQNIAIHILPKDLGFVDTTLRAGWNSVMVRLDGTDYAQDIVFYPVEIAAADMSKATWTDFGPAHGVSNTNWL